MCAPTHVFRCRRSADPLASAVEVGPAMLSSPVAIPTVARACLLTKRIVFVDARFQSRPAERRCEAPRRACLSVTHQNWYPRPAQAEAHWRFNCASQCAAPSSWSQSSPEFDSCLLLLFHPSESPGEASCISAWFDHALNSLTPAARECARTARPILQQRPLPLCSPGRLSPRGRWR